MATPSGEKKKHKRTKKNINERKTTHPNEGGEMEEGLEEEVDGGEEEVDKEEDEEEENVQDDEEDEKRGLKRKEGKERESDDNHRFHELPESPSSPSSSLSGNAMGGGGDGEGEEGGKGGQWQLSSGGEMKKQKPNRMTKGKPMPTIGKAKKMAEAEELRRRITDEIKDHLSS